MTARCCGLIKAARATRTNCSGCDSDGTAASLSEAEFLEASDRRSEVDRVFGHYAVLFLKIVDDIALLLVEPAGVRDQDELQGMRLRRHGNSLSEAEFTRSLGRPFGVDPVFGQYADTLLQRLARLECRGAGGIRDAPIAGGRQRGAQIVAQPFAVVIAQRRHGLGNRMPEGAPLRH